MPRPENTIARSDKMHLWEVKVKDNLVKDATEKIKKTLSDNLEVVEMAIKVYDKYLFILKERERIEAFLNKENFSREEF